MTSDALPPASAASRWRTRLAAARPAWSDEIAALAAAPIDRAAIDAVLARERGEGWRDDAGLDAGLRRARARLFAAVIDRDLGGAADTAEVLVAMTSLAEATIASALGWHAQRLADRHGVPTGRDSGAPQDLAVVGMGKLGGGELNASSDVDLVFVYGEDGETRPAPGQKDARPIGNDEFFTRLGRKLIGSLSEVTADGHVFRVDMRLRPDGDAGPLVSSLAMLERYLVASARDWERFAWIKGRVVSPPVFAAPLEPELDALVVPFVYRRYLDFGAIDALRRLHAQIRDEASRREAVRAGRASHGAAQTIEPRIDVKLGRGGIREIEFIAQHFQLIRGGRDPALRIRPTRATIARLVQRGLIDAATGDRLLVAYAFLRDVEHRVQYLDDAQTHVLPASDAVDDRARLATMVERLHPDAPGFDGFLATLAAHRAFVERQFDAVFRSDPASPADHAPPGCASLWDAFIAPQAVLDAESADAKPLRDALATLGFDPPDAAFARLAGLARSARLRGLPSSARERLDALVPRLVEASRGEADPGATLARWFDLIEAIAGRSAYLALLAEYPAVRADVTRLLGASPWAAQYLVRHPILLDELIDAPETAHEPRDADAWSGHWRDVARALDDRLVAATGDAERQMDTLREVHHGETFRLLIEDLDGALTIESLSDQLSALADLILDAALRHCRREFEAKTNAPLPPFVVVAYGKLGGKELGYASDLDVVFLFDPRGDPDAGTRCVRFAQRLVSWLTARTTAGALFDIDLRLRPDGMAGLVASSFDAWSRYERRAQDVGAWTWEHQALTRARFAAGDGELGAAFEVERAAILTDRPQDGASRARLRGEIEAMRKRMHDGHPNRSGRFDLKHDPGGMVDVEFAVQYLVLAFGASHRELVANAGNIALLARASAAGLVDPADAAAAADAYRLYRARQHAVRLAEPGAQAARVAADEYVAERAGVRRLWSSLFG